MTDTNAASANDTPRPSMTGQQAAIITMYGVKRDRQATDPMYEVLNLAKVGAAATDTNLALDHMLNAQCTMFEMIYRLASEAVDLVETGDKAGEALGGK